ncbi:MAG: ABC transporter ATP-binding protein [Bacteroidales bacterium]|nr:ABC transporter ATP-binding protein [Bacteroidales bacterium]
MQILQVDNVTKRYAAHTALDDVSLAVDEGSIYGLLGPNGAGKTTLIRIINHITAPDSGTVTLNGHRLTSDDVTSIGYLPEERGLYKKMKVGEQAMFFARLKGLSRGEAKRRLTRWFEKFDIMPWWNKKVEELSKGMAQKIQFIVTVLHEPRLLIFDEPFSGFDPINADLLKREILELRDHGATIIFSTHNMDSVERVCDSLTLINQGRNILSGNVEQIRRDASKGLVALEFEGDQQQLLAALGDRVKHYKLSPETGALGRKLTLELNDDQHVKEVVDLANEAVTLNSFTRVIPSMDEIFINTVNQNNILVQ